MSFRTNGGRGEQINVSSRTKHIRYLGSEHLKGALEYLKGALEVDWEYLKRAPELQSTSAEVDWECLKCALEVDWEYLKRALEVDWEDRPTGYQGRDQHVDGDVLLEAKVLDRILTRKDDRSHHCIIRVSVTLYFTYIK